MLEITDI